MTPEDGSRLQTTTTDPTFTPDEALEQTIALLEAAQEIVGGEWENGDSGATDCGLPSGAIGAQYALQRLGPGVPAGLTEETAQAVATLWKEAGYESIVVPFTYPNDVTVLEVRSPATGWHPNGSYLLYGASALGSYVSAYTPCAPGDSAEINRRWHEENDPQ